MKKDEVKKLRLSRETLRDLRDSDFRKVLGGADSGDDQNNMSCQSAGRCLCTSDPS